eukprot:TRINITY_DN68029_c9_g1_i5.p1 TRINITY_DN68029_c9_g1~~TRINITY_DN68029_c9_g1_i5.p1  ORF type:complete len:771 (+),score=47.87 TRINITY_DN68029_c9_g1_i5:78-2315(+)
MFKPPPPPPPPDPPPVPFTVKSVKLSGVAGPSAARWECNMSVTILTPVNGYLTCPLLPSAIAVEELTIRSFPKQQPKDENNAHQAHVVTLEKNHCLVATSQGDYELAWVLYTPYTSSLQQAVQLPVPRSTRVALEFFVPAPQQEFRVTPTSHLEYNSEDSGTRCKCIIPSCDSVELKWSKAEPLLHRRPVADEIILCEQSEQRFRRQIQGTKLTEWDNLRWNEFIQREDTFRNAIVLEERKMRMRLTSHTVTCEQFIGHQLQGETITSNIACYFTSTNGALLTVEIRIDGHHGTSSKESATAMEGSPCKVFSVTGKCLSRWEIVDEQNRQQLLRLFFNPNVPASAPRPKRVGTASSTAGDDEEYEVHIHTELQMVASSCSLRLPTFTPLRMHRITGCIGIQCLSIVEVNQLKTSRISRTDVQSLPQIIRPNSLYGYKFLVPQYELSLKVVQHSGVGTLAAVIEEASCEVVYTKQYLLYHCKYKLKNTFSQFARITLPSSTCTLWSALIENRGVTPAADGSKILMPLLKNTDDAFIIELIFVEKIPSTLEIDGSAYGVADGKNPLLASSDDLSESEEGKLIQIPIPLPHIDIPINYLLVKLYLPEYLKEMEFRSDSLVRTYDTRSSLNSFTPQVDDDMICDEWMYQLQPLRAREEPAAGPNKASGALDTKAQTAQNEAGMKTLTIDTAALKNGTQVLFEKLLVGENDSLHLNVFARDTSDFSLVKPAKKPEAKKPPQVQSGCCSIM